MTCEPEDSNLGWKLIFIEQNCYKIDRWTLNKMWSTECVDVVASGVV
jgi:hypothetical protein